MVTSTRPASAELHATIRARLDAIASERDKLEARLAELRHETEELTTTQRVIARLLAASIDSETAKPTPEPPVARDPNLPTVPDMIKSVVGDMMVLETPAANQSILTTMVTRWGPQDPNIVRPTIWRMWKANRLLKDGEAYVLPSQTRSTTAHSASEIEDFNFETEAASPVQEDAA